MKKHRIQGFSLIELVIYIVIMGIIGLSIFAGMNTALESESIVDDNTQAMIIAQQRMEAIIGQRKTNGFTPFVDPCESPAFFPDELCAVGAYAFGYTVTSTITTGFNGNNDLKEVTVEVTGPGTATLSTLLGNFVES